MELRQLRTFIAVAELRHFARAANLCNLSQPAVSHQIALLEEELGAKLLNRASRRVSLTVAGEVFLEEARRILGAVDRASGWRRSPAVPSVGFDWAPRPRRDSISCLRSWRGFAPNTKATICASRSGPFTSSPSASRATTWTWRSSPARCLRPN